MTLFERKGEYWRLLDGDEVIRRGDLCCNGHLSPDADVLWAHPFHAVGKTVWAASNTYCLRWLRRVDPLSAAMITALGRNK